ncbi:fimbrial biogenesis chaperone [Providencia hangzhouensis]|uniref:fimbrial biogenesis chaperone n=1 Tax=Providencia TaxID=586 RepID=UPI000D834F35|nr:MULTISPECIES: molecular chaperone [Providencia]PYZ61023.1 molecular chaperone [Providencia rettgeri]QIF64404.1 molecular chaperone [Providencia sp. 1709051003]WOB95615.1 molecular chaperone [Providencia sp. PROV099]
MFFRSLGLVPLFLSLFFSFISVSWGENRTLVFSYQRTTFIEGEKSVSFRILNDTDKTPYLMQSSVELLDEGSGLDIKENNINIPFMVTPPLHKLEAGNSYTWRVMFIGDNDKLAKDRETVYIVKYRAIPPLDKNMRENNSSIDVNTIQVLHFKVYYRPKQFANLTIENEQKKISFRREGNNIIVKNNSPIYMSFESLAVNGVSVGYKELFKPIKPLSEQIFISDSKIRDVNTITWSVLDELVLELPKNTSTL